MGSSTIGTGPQAKIYATVWASNYGTVYGRAAILLQSDLWKLRKTFLVENLVPLQRVYESMATRSEIPRERCGRMHRTSANFTEKDLHRVFVMAWNGILENRDNLMDYWKQQIENGDVLERYRAKQFIELTKDSTPLQELDLTLVGKTLEYVTVEKMGILNFFFLDGTEIGIAMNT